MNTLNITREFALRWMPQALADDKSTLVQQQAITWANVDPILYCHMVSPGQSKTMCWLIEAK